MPSSGCTAFTKHTHNCWSIFQRLSVDDCEWFWVLGCDADPKHTHQHWVGCRDGFHDWPQSLHSVVKAHLSHVICLSREWHQFKHKMKRRCNKREIRRSQKQVSNICLMLLIWYKLLCLKICSWSPNLVASARTPSAAAAPASSSPIWYDQLGCNELAAKLWN